MKYLIVVCTFLIVFNSFPQSEKNKNNPSKPNLIYILADDLGIGNVGTYGSDKFSTPHIDQLAKNGIQFNHSYTAPLCGPSRAMILTGRYAFRTGATNQARTGLIKPSNEILIPSVLKQAGYITSAIGKWSQFSLDPSDFGFDDYFRFKGSGGYWNEDKNKQRYKVNGKEVRLKDTEYIPDLMHDHLVNFIANNKDKPFYIHYSMSHIHGKIQATPDSKRNSRDFYADNIVYMDKLIGKLLDVLDSLKIRENTLLIFMGDNGTAPNFAEISTVKGKQLSGNKGTMLEGGSLVPMIANWPALIHKGRVSEALIDASDILPTFAELAKAKLPDNTVIDGHSFISELTGGKSNQREWIFIELGNKWYAREAKWKLNNAGELFDMSNAPFEEKLVTNYSQDKEATAAFKRLKKVLEKLNPAGGVLDDGDGSGKR